jgi:type I restriction enzyme S subunit
MSDLPPAGWAVATIGSLCQLINGRAFKPTDWKPTGLPIIRIQNLNNPEAPFNKYPGDFDQKHLVSDGDLLFAWSGTPGTSFGAHVWMRGKAILNQHIFRVIHDRQRVDRDFFKIAINFVLEELIFKAHGGAGLAHITKGRFEETQILLPPLAEQRRIVARIEALFARTRRARTDLERIASLSNKYFAATLKKSFEGLLTETWRSEPQVAVTQNRDNGPKGPYELPSGWSWQYLPALGELARGKSRHRPRNAGFLYGGRYPFIQTGDVRAAQGRLRTYEQTYSEAGLAQSKLWPRDTVCITIAANIAETAILDIEACFPDSVVGFKAAQHTCLPEFIEYFIRTAKADLAAFAPATAQKNINLETLEGVLVPTPSLAEQRECVRLLSRSELAADACRREATRALALLDRLEQSILARAFRGELVSSSSAREQDTISQIPVEKDMPTTGRRKVRAVAA